MSLWGYSEKRGNLVAWVTITVVCIATYLHCLSFGITNSDDDILITSNLAFLTYLPNITHVFSTDAFYLHKSIDLYRPLQSATFILDAQWGVNPVFSAHLTNIILHTLTCLVLFKLLRLLEFRAKIAFLGALVYAVHYLFMSAVAWLPARGDLLLALFVFLSLATFIKIITVGGWSSYLLHGLFFILAIFSKESAVVLPIVLVLYLWGYARLAILTRYHLWLPVFYLVVQALYFYLKSRAVVLYNGDTGVYPLLKNIRYLPETVAKFFLPLNISTLPVYKLHSTSAGVLIIIGFAGFFLLGRRKFDRRVLFFIGWTLLFMVPSMLYYPAFYNFAYEHLDHRAYISCFGLLMLTLYAVQRFDLEQERYFNVISLLLLIYLAAFNVYFSRSYRNPSEFALRAIRTNPNSALAYSIYGRELYQQGRDDEALESLNKSLGIFSRYTEALHTRAQIYRKKGLNLAAIADLDAIVSFEPTYSAEVYLLRAEIRIDLQDFDGALRDYGEALKLDPENGVALKGARELQREGAR
jgi:tetratricopeptide (TPR) repeat protein